MKKIILTESDRKKIISEKEKAIVESFAKTFNKIKRLDENEIRSFTNEYADEVNEAERTSMSEFFGKETDNVDTLLTMFSIHQPKKGWLMTVGYVNGADLNVTINNNNMPELEKIARELGNPAFISMVDSPEWKEGIKTGKNVKNPFATQKPRGGDEIPTTLYTTKKFMLQWENTNMKPEKDAAVKSVYDKYGIDWEKGKIKTDDKRGLGWEPIPSTPFKQHQDKGTQALSYYSKQDVSKGMGKTKYFLKFENSITELSKSEVNFIYSLSPKKSSDVVRKLEDLPAEAAAEIKQVEDLYSFKTLDLTKIMYINCSMEVEGKNMKFSYINYNVVPKGLKPGEFKEFIKASINN